MHLSQVCKDRDVDEAKQRPPVEDVGSRMQLESESHLKIPTSTVPVRFLSCTADVNDNDGRKSLHSIPSFVMYPLLMSFAKRNEDSFALANQFVFSAISTPMEMAVRVEEERKRRIVVLLLVLKRRLYRTEMM